MENTTCGVYPSGVGRRDGIELYIFGDEGEGFFLLRGDRDWSALILSELTGAEVRIGEELAVGASLRGQCRAVGEFGKEMFAYSDILHDWPENLDARDLPDHMHLEPGESIGSVYEASCREEVPETVCVTFYHSIGETMPNPTASTAGTTSSTTPAAKPSRAELDSKGFFYDKFRKEYLLRNAGGWISLSERQFIKELAFRGYNPSRGRELISEADRAAIRIRQERDVAYAAPLAGHREGVFEFNGNRILVTTSPKIPEPRDIDWTLLRTVIENMLADPEHDQTLFLYCWLKVAFESLRSGNLRPGQALCLAGPRECGKSLFQQILTEILGGRVAKPAAYMLTSTSFNYDLFGCEHLCMEDECASTDIRIRRDFGNKIKQVAGNETQRCEGKYRDGIALNPFWRLTITLNDEPENLMILPPLDESIIDKIIILKCTQAPMPLSTEDDGDRKRFFEALVSCIPGLLYHVCKMQIPAALVSQRYGITHFHHPAIIRELDGLSPEFRLMQLIDKRLFDLSDLTVYKPWAGTAKALEDMLTGTKDSVEKETRALLHFSTALGVYLARLANKHPNRVSKHRSPESRIWIISPPKE